MKYKYICFVKRIEHDKGEHRKGHQLADVSYKLGFQMRQFRGVVNRSVSSVAFSQLPKVINSVFVWLSSSYLADLSPPLSCCDTCQNKNAFPKYLNHNFAISVLPTMKNLTKEALITNHPWLIATIRAFRHPQEYLIHMPNSQEIFYTWFRIIVLVVTLAVLSVIPYELQDST